MDPNWGLDIAGLIFSVLPLLSMGTYELCEVLTLRSIRDIYARLFYANGLFHASTLLLIFPNAEDVVHRIEKYVLQSKGDEPMVLKKSLSEDYSMLAVAVAITALQTEYLGSVHWTSRAAFIISLVTALLSVFYSCLLQRKLSGLFDANDVKTWLSKPSGSKEREKVDRMIRDLLRRQRDVERPSVQDGSENSSTSTGEVNLMEEARKLVIDFRDRNRWASVSYSSAIMIQTPALLLNYSLGSFLIGLGIYLGYVAAENLDPSTNHDSSFAVLGVYIAVTVIAILLYFVPSTFKELELAPVRRWQILLDSGLRQDSSTDSLRPKPDLEALFRERPAPDERLDTTVPLQPPFDAVRQNTFDTISDNRSWKERLEAFRRPDPEHPVHSRNQVPTEQEQAYHSSQEYLAGIGVDTLSDPASQNVKMTMLQRIPEEIAPKNPGGGAHPHAVAFFAQADNTPQENVLGVVDPGPSTDPVSQKTKSTQAQDLAEGALRSTSDPFLAALQASIVAQEQLASCLKALQGQHVRVRMAED
ncbi:hypothetical protein BDW74DRAFT_180031 [Aspergillus multicolor]|uniref:uncharacterized protein n=1 Tax=Aspergillus multicolor TaxID=41759 RepID=UPI003CCCF63F